MQSTIEVSTARSAGEHRLRVVGERVACRRIGTTDIRRCAECVYLLRLGRKYILCADRDAPEEPDFPW